MPKKKFYVVWSGHKTGVFTSWNVCKKHIQNFQGAQYKSFTSKEEAEKAYKGNYVDYVGKDTKKVKLSASELKRIGKPIMNTIAVDGACNNKGIAEYQGVYTDTKTELFKLGPFKGGSNNLMEFLALVHGLAYLKKNKLDLPIYSDSRTAISWVWKKKVKTTIKRTSENQQIFELDDRAMVWLDKNPEMVSSSIILKWETKAWGEIPADFGRK